MIKLNGEIININHFPDGTLLLKEEGVWSGGGDWNKVYSMIEEIFADCDVTLYEYNGG